MSFSARSSPVIRRRRQPSPRNPQSLHPFAECAPAPRAEGTRLARLGPRRGLPAVLAVLDDLTPTAMAPARCDRSEIRPRPLAPAPAARRVRPAPAVAAPRREPVDGSDWATRPHPSPSAAAPAPAPCHPPPRPACAREALSRLGNRDPPRPIATKPHGPPRLGPSRRGRNDAELGESTTVPPASWGDSELRFVGQSVAKRPERHGRWRRRSLPPGNEAILQRRREEPLMPPLPPTGEPRLR
jgi:hypothetical protein